MENVFYWGNLILSYGVSGYVLFKFLFQLFEPKYRKNIYFFAYFIFVILAIIVYRLNIPVLKSFYGIISIIFIGNVLFFSKSKAKIISASILFFLYMFIVDTLSVLLFTTISGRTTEIVRSSPQLLFLCGLGNQVILLCFYKPFVQIMQKHKFDSIFIQQNVFLVSLAIFQVYFINYILKIIDTTMNSLILTFLSIGFLGIDIYLIYLFEAISQRYQLEKEIDLKEQYEAMQSSYYHNVEMQYDQSRRLIHDMRNHMQTLEELYVGGNKKDAEKYAETIYKLMDEMGRKFNCQNRILTIIINDKLLKCDEKNIDLQTNIEDIDLDFIDSFDMTTIFSNLLDNAIEASESLKLEERIIVVKMFKRQDFITISISNNFLDKPILKKDELLTTKKGHHMGIGIKNVKTAVEKYNGNFRYEIKDQKFEVKIIFFV